MDTNFDRPSAKIYQFPVKNRRFEARDVLENSAPRRGPAAVCEIESGSGWYHQEAIRQADPTRKN